MVEEHSTYIIKVQSFVCSSMPHSATAWSCPPNGMVKVDVDAHIAASFVGVGVVMREDTGKVILTTTKRVHGGTMADVAEALAARYGAMLARRFGYKRVWLERDAVCVTRTVSTKIKGLSPLFLIFDDIGNIALLFDAFIISHIRRAGNTVAHLVARWDTRDSIELICMNSFPQSIITLADLDFQ